MGKWLLLLFVILPITEIWLLVQIGRQIGFLPLVAFLVGVGVVGSMLAKAEGARVLRAIGRARQEGRVPEEGLLSAGMILFAGVLLVIPGVITDALGLVLLFPPTRRLLAGVVRRWFEARVAQGGIHVHQVGRVDPMDRPIDEDSDGGDVIDVDVEAEVKANAKPRESRALPKPPDERD